MINHKTGAFKNIAALLYFVRSEAIRISVIINQWKYEKLQKKI